MTFRAFAALCLGGVLLNFFAAQAATPSPYGLWLTSDQEGVIAITACGKDICGHIAGVSLDHPNDAMPTNWRGEPECGEPFIQAAPATNAPGKWRGTILDPNSGHVWNAMISVQNGNLRLHGYFAIPIFGETQNWTPFTGHIGSNCLFIPPGSP